VTKEERTAMKSKLAEVREITLKPLQRDHVVFCVKGKTPLVMNAMSFRAKAILLGLKRRTPKPDPDREFREALYTYTDHDHATRLWYPGTAFKQACMNAALEIPGMVKRKVGIEMRMAQDVDIYGLPEVFTTTTRTLDRMDTKTMAILPRWCCYVGVDFIVPNLTPEAVANLMNVAGEISGIGQWRMAFPGHGGEYGGWELCGPDDPEFVAVKQMDREAQDAAIANPVIH
jgi:hypothetical protein